MKIGNGLSYRIQNLRTGEWTNFHSTDVYQYEGAWLVYGFTSAHEVRVAAGLQPVNERSSSFVLMPDEPQRVLGRFVNQLKGLPLGLADPAGGEVMFIVNTGLCGHGPSHLAEEPSCPYYHEGVTVQNGHPRLLTRDAHLQKCKWVVNEYRKRKKTGRLAGAGRSNGRTKLYDPRRDRGV